MHYGALYFRIPQCKKFTFPDQFSFLLNRYNTIILFKYIFIYIAFSVDTKHLRVKNIEKKIINKENPNTGENAIRIKNLKKIHVL